MSVKALILPGYGNSGEGHWQTLWEKANPSFSRVDFGAWEHPVAADWIARLEEAVMRSGSDTYLIAHSLACLLVAKWAASTRLVVRGAFLVAAPDPRAEVFPSCIVGFGDVSLLPFEFPSVLVASSDDVYATLGFSRTCAARWGSEFVEIGPAGHINANSGFGVWSQGERLLQNLIERIDQESDS
jgi:hypothetical protein